MFRHWLLFNLVFVLAGVGNLEAGTEDIALYNNNARALGQYGSAGQSNVVGIYKVSTGTVQGVSTMSGYTTRTVLFNVSGGDTVIAFQQCAYAGGQASNYIGSHISSGGGGTYTFIYDPCALGISCTTGFGCGGTNPPCTYGPVKVINPGPMYAFGWWAMDGVIVHEDTDPIAPGGSSSYTYQFDCGTQHSFTYGYKFGDPVVVVPTGGEATVTNNTVTQQTGTNFVDSSGGTGLMTTNQPVWLYSTNNQVAWSNYALGGGINFNGTSTTAARDDTLKAGFNALHQDLQDLKALEGAEAGRSNMVSGGSGTNVVNVTNSLTLNVTNAPDIWGSNIFGVSTNWHGNTNRLAGIGEQQGAGSNLMNNAYGQLSAATGYVGGFGNWGAGTPSQTFHIVPVGLGSLGTAGLSWDLTLDANDSQFSVFDWVRRAFLVMIYLWLFWQSFELIKEAALKVLTVPQATTAGESVLGSNINAASALAIGAIIAALVVVLVTLGVASLAVIGGLLAPAIADLAGVGSTFPIAWGFVTRAVPLDTMAAAALVYWVMRIVVSALGVGVALFVKVLTGV